GGQGAVPDGGRVPDARDQRRDPRQRVLQRRALERSIVRISVVLGDRAVEPRRVVGGGDQLGGRDARVGRADARVPTHDRPGRSGADGGAWDDGDVAGRGRRRGREGRRGNSERKGRRRGRGNRRRHRDVLRPDAGGGLRGRPAGGGELRVLDRGAARAFGTERAPGVLCVECAGIRGDRGAQVLGDEPFGATAAERVHADPGGSGLAAGDG